MKNIEPNQPKIKPLAEIPETLMALMLGMWEKELGEIPKLSNNLIVTYFDTIYTNHPLREDYYIHEMVHFIRQGNGENQALAQDFCMRYLRDRDFRLQEEILAYREQYRFRKASLNRPQAFEYAKFLAKELSSEKYGKDLISFHGALQAITSTDGQ